MYLLKNKVLLINIIAYFAMNFEALEIKIAELSAGDIININYLNAKSTETYGDIFNGYKDGHLIEVKHLTGGRQISVEKKICLPFKDLASYYYPEIIVDNTKFDSSKIFNYTNQSNLFGIDPGFINKEYSYGIIKVCWISKTQKVLTQVLEKKDFPLINNRVNYKLLLDKTAVLRFRHENETHYVSSISTGECFLQAFENSAGLCSQTGTKKLAMNPDDIDSFIISSRYESRVKTTSSIQERENRINNYLILQKISLYHLNNMEVAILFDDEFRPAAKQSIIELNLRILPDLPKLPSLPTAHDEFMSDIVPGDVINIDDFKHIYSVIRTDNFLVDIYDHTTSPFTYINYTNCYQFSENEKIKIKYSPYELHPNYFTEYYYKLDVFDEMVRRKNYGVDPIYLNDRFKCLKIKICSGFERTKLIIPTVYVVNLDKNDPDKLHFFDSKNVVLRYKLGNETHYVARTEKGNCLFQALIYENSEDFSHNQQIRGPFLFKGKILSANNDQNLEKWAEKTVRDLSTNDNNNNTLIELINNPIAMSDLNSKYSREVYSNTMINLYLDKLH